MDNQNRIEHLLDLKRVNASKYNEAKNEFDYLRELLIMNGFTYRQYIKFIPILNTELNINDNDAYIKSVLRVSRSKAVLSLAKKLDQLLKELNFRDEEYNKIEIALTELDFFKERHYSIAID